MRSLATRIVAGGTIGGVIGGVVTGGSPHGIGFGMASGGILGGFLGVTIGPTVVFAKAILESPAYPAYGAPGPLGWTPAQLNEASLDARDAVAMAPFVYSLPPLIIPAACYILLWR